MGLNLAAIFIAALLFLAVGGMSAAVEAALAVTSRSDLLAAANRVKRGKLSLQALADDGPAHSTTASFVRVGGQMAAAVLVTVGCSELIPNVWLLLLVSALTMSALSFVLVGTSPRSVGRAHPIAVLRVCGPLSHVFRVALGPIVWALIAIGNRVAPGRASFAGVASEEHLLNIVDDATERDVIDNDDRELIHSVVEFKDTIVHEIMVPRTDMVTVAAQVPIDELIELSLESGHSRIPIVKGDAAEVTGVAYLRDALRVSRDTAAPGTKPAKRTRTAQHIARPPTFVPDSMNVDALMRQMQAEVVHLALVVDEYGDIVGLVTLEDIIEELVGEIEDEFDRAGAATEEVGSMRFRVSSRLGARDLGELFGIEIEDEDVDTTGGLLTKALGRVPVVGDTGEIYGLHLTAERTGGRRRGITTIIAESAEVRG